MTQPFKPTLLALAAAAWLSAPTLAQAEFVPSTAPLQVIAEPGGSPGSPRQALDFLTQAIARDAQVMDSGRVPVASAREFDFSGDGAGAGEGGRAFKLGVGQLIEPPKQLRGDVDLFLWSLLRLVHAQREGKHFELVDRGVEFVLSNYTDQPSAVPLPGALWLFVMGLLGLAGTRFTGKRDETAPAGRREPALPRGGTPVPA